jgi:ferric-dicitrate binding protein FerR (iron transport regulator)
MDRLNEPDIPEDLRELIDAHVAGTLTEVQLADLDARLCADADARRYFVRYCRLHADLGLLVRAQRAGSRALRQLDGPEPPAAPELSPHRASRTRFPARRVVRWAAAAAILLLAAGLGWFLARGWAPEQGVAWLVNAQDCRWPEGPPAEGLHVGSVLRVEQGLVELNFRSGARVLLEGPAGLEILSARSARLLRGRVVVTVSDPALGFEVVSPRGKVIDRGTEFGVSVAEDGATDVLVFQGKVDTQSADRKSLHLEKDQAARIDNSGVVLKPLTQIERFVRAIVPPPVVVPRTLDLAFRRAVPASLPDGDGKGIGLTHRLPGTGEKLPPLDPNLRLDLDKGYLDITTTESDINRAFKLDTGEYLGIRLSDLGFTGDEDFAVTASLPDIPALAFIGQFGLYVGSRSDCNIRGGLLGRKEEGRYTIFLVNNNGGRDTDSHFVGLFSTGDHLVLTMRRRDGKYSLTVENRTNGSSSTVTIRHPAFLDGKRDLFVGLFAANPRSEVHRPIRVKNFQATVWTRSSPPQS